jgi:hypothetical protein
MMQVLLSYKVIMDNSVVAILEAGDGAFCVVLHMRE